MREWVILTTSGGINGFDAANWSLDTGGLSTPIAGSPFGVFQSGNNLVLSYSPIPEPSTAGALLFAAALAALVKSKHFHRRG
ncbi:MAG: PEP-CTERM sorting domain-containing protein [Chthoniobacterales bacterium]